MTPRRLVHLLVSVAVAGPLVGCGGGEAGGGPSRRDPVPLREPSQEQVIRADTVLQPCTVEAESDELDGNDSVAARVVSIVLPLAYRVDPFPQDLPAATLEGDGWRAYLPTCGFIVGRGVDSARAKGRDVFSVTVPASQSLREALPRLASKGSPQKVESGVRVFAGRDGERATYTLREPGIADYDVVAVQADGVRLTWLAPVGRTPSEASAGRRLWRDVQRQPGCSLARGGRR